MLSKRGIIEVKLVPQKRSMLKIAMTLLVGPVVAGRSHTTTKIQDNNRFVSRLSASFGLWKSVAEEVDVGVGGNR
jgi:hypothetical protein